MKLNLISILIMLFSMTLSAQTTQPLSQTTTSVSNETSTNEYITIEDKSFEIFENQKGTQYIKSEGRNGEYPLWIGKETVHKGQKVRLTKSGKEVILYLKLGKPRAKYNSLEPRE